MGPSPNSIKEPAKSTPVKSKKKRGKRKKRKKADVMKGIENSSVTDNDDTMTIESSSTAPSSTQYQEYVNGDDTGWITKQKHKNRRDSNKNKKKQPQKNQSKDAKSNQVASPASTKSSVSKTSFTYNSDTVSNKSTKKGSGQDKQAQPKKDSP